MPIEIRCPSCQRKLRVPDELLGRTVKCPSCQATFTAATTLGEAPVETYVPEEAPATLRREGAPERDEDEREETREPEEEAYDDRPHGRRGERRSSAKSSVMGPAVALIVVGSLGLVYAIINLIVNFLGIAGPFNAPGRQPGFGQQPGFGPPVDPNVYQVIVILVTLVMLLWGGLVLFGGIQMLRLRSFGMAMAGSIVAIIPCNPCCLFGLPFGIWALIMLNYPEVKRAFD
jgi:predicted Zn finger-like uncharacterized protein